MNQKQKKERLVRLNVERKHYLEAKQRWIAEAAREKAIADAARAEAARLARELELARKAALDRPETCELAW